MKTGVDNSRVEEPRVDQDEAGAWLETGTGDRIPIRGNCSIGRSPKSRVVLDSPKVSRRHAIINVQDVGEFWLIDLGSINGTFLNKRRVNHPVRLTDFDQVTVGDATYVFRQPVEITGEYKAAVTQRTIREIANVPCWLLVADVEDFTPLSQSMENDKLATVIGGWVSTCKQVIEDHHGLINKYLGDGFLAYWRDDADSAKTLAGTLIGLKALQERQDPRFRIALHFGPVAIGGMESMGEESLMGKEVNFVFRMEKLAGSLGIPRLTSAAGKSRLESLIKCEPAGGHELKGFEGQHEFFSC
jgi:class 3 adenylate cyclase